MLRLLILLPLCAAAVLARGAEPTFYRGINLFGPSLTIDGQVWDGNDAADFACNGKGFENQDVPLKPATDDTRARMLRSSRWGREIDVDLTKVPNGAYLVWLYVWEDNRRETFDVLVNDKLVLKKFVSGEAGEWKKLGPWRTNVSAGKLRVSARGGDANLSGLEVWSAPAGAFATDPPAEDLAFFESKIRPLLVKHCYECHSGAAKELGGGLLVDSRAGLVKGGDTEPPIQPGDPDSSLLIRAVKKTDPDLQMPPEGALTAAEIADLERWIRLGAPDPRTENTVQAAAAKYAIDWEKARDFWSLRPLPAEVSPPQVQAADWPANDLDRFILAKQEAAGTKPAPDADKATLLRRVTFDLIGLPPTPDELDAFLADDSPEAYRAVVDRLLASKQYGERWGRHWLDVVRYADTAGDNSDFPIPQQYRYRNWVIDAFNRDLPYDQFVREQLAGDLLGGATQDEANARLIATGYIANARRFGSRVDDYPQHLTIEDTLDNLGRAFLATTINCARCHNHKFDPVTTEDYYALYGVFHSTRYPWPGIELEQRQRDLAPLASAEDVARADAERKSQLEPLQAEEKRLEKERDAAKDDARKQIEKQLNELRKKIAAVPSAYELAYAVAEGKKIEHVAVQQKGDPAKLGRIVPRRFLTVLGGESLPETDRTSGRLALANWIVDAKNPLTARVIVNRVWQLHFGRGLVPTANDFGRQGRPPSHPELLDALAVRFIREGWSFKSLHRDILLSRTYRQSGERDAAPKEADPANELLAGFPRRRLDAEAIRDTLLATSGDLDPSPGGPHPFPPASEWKFTQHNPFKAVYDTNRRSVYLMTQRIQRHPFLAIFDGADPSVSVAGRLVSTTPLQALYLMNDPFVHERARGIAKRLAAVDRGETARIEFVYKLLFGRTPREDEISAGLSFLAEIRGGMREDGLSNQQVELAALEAYVRALVRLNEFVYVD